MSARQNKGRMRGAYEAHGSREAFGVRGIPALFRKIPAKARGCRALQTLREIHASLGAVRLEFLPFPNALSLSSKSSFGFKIEIDGVGPLFFLRSIREGA